mmetsp:Transcript_63072/g.184997  ORF Transcript_63072/g.184997 Transcript_63072/m.184997 type:complete len:234 (-) Transcript_63072:2069-2770(-)
MDSRSWSVNVPRRKRETLISFSAKARPLRSCLAWKTTAVAPRPRCWASRYSPPNRCSSAKEDSFLRSEAVRGSATVLRTPCVSRFSRSSCLLANPESVRTSSSSSASLVTRTVCRSVHPTAEGLPSSVAPRRSRGTDCTDLPLFVSSSVLLEASSSMPPPGGLGYISPCVMPWNSSSSMPASRPAARLGKLLHSLPASLQRDSRCSTTSGRSSKMYTVTSGLPTSSATETSTP